MPLTPGTRLGLYEIIAAIGAGGMGEVYRARDRRLERTVAIKVLTDSFDHPDIRVLHDVGDHDVSADGQRIVKWTAGLEK